MRVLVAGASGFIGRALLEALKKQGCEIFTLVRDDAKVNDHAFFWDPANGTFNFPLDYVDGVINLSGENIATGRWTKNKKEKILNSRLHATNTCVKLIQSLKIAPKVFINASAIGFYGDRGDELLTEESSPGNNFLADVCNNWEKAAFALENEQTRVVVLRFGAVLSKNGGALAKMLIPFKLGLGGKIGSGAQYFSFIGLEDLCRVILFAIETEQLEGVINAVTPYPVTNQEFTKTLGKVLHRPTFLSVPAMLARLVFGQMADEVLLTSQKVYPKKLLSAGFQFNNSFIYDCLNDFKLKNN